MTKRIFSRQARPGLSARIVPIAGIVFMLVHAGVLAQPLSAPIGNPAVVPPAPRAEGQPDITRSTNQEGKNAEIFPGTGNLFGTPTTQPAPAMASQENTIALNFANADIRDVAKVVLGDYLNFSYEIAANVQGSVTLQTSSPLTRAQLLPVLEQALQLNGLALVQANGVFRIVLIEDARSAAGAVRLANGAQRSQGYGIEVVPVRFVSAAELQKLIEPLAPAQGLIHVDTARNILLIEGTAEERQTLLDNIALFDADWLSGMSFALYTPKYTDVQELGKELTQILGNQTASTGGALRLVPIARLNAILAISTQRQYLDHLAAWVERLDRPGEGTDKRLFVYRVQNGRASDLAATLSSVLFGARENGPAGRAAPVAESVGAPPDASPPPDTGAGGVRISAIGAINITADETNNALVILATAQEYATIQAALQQLDAVPIQVFLEAAIAEITLNDELRYGVQYFFERGKHDVILSSGSSALIGPSFPGFSYIFSDGPDFRAVLDAIAGVTHVEVVSSPKLLVLNNQAAMLQVGDRVPIVTQQATSVLTSEAPILNSVQYQDTGVILKVTPRVNRGGIVLMDVAQEVSGVTITTSSTIDSPTIQQRKISSSVAVQDGDTVVLGGLIRDDVSRTRSGIPFLQSIPAIGNLFRATGNEKTRTELLVFITPHVVDTMEKSKAVTQELRSKLPALQPLFQKGNGLEHGPQ